MVFDFTKAPVALALGCLFWVVSAALTDVLAQAFCEWCGDYIGAAAVWQGVFIVATPLYSADSPMISSRMRGLIQNMCQFLAGGHKGLMGGLFTKRSHITQLMMILMGALSVYMIMRYCILYVESR